MAEFPLAWQEALDYIAVMNRDNVFGFADWRLPNRRELRSLMSYQTRKPALPEGHPFVNVFDGWYWTSTTAAINTAYAWYIHMEGARMFYGRKDQFYLLWPVRGKMDTILPATGQTRCYDAKGQLSPAQDQDRTENSGQGCDGLNPALRRQEVWSSTGSQTSAGSHQRISPEDRRHGRKRSKQ